MEDLDSNKLQPYFSQQFQIKNKRYKPKCDLRHMEQGDQQICEYINQFPHMATALDQGNDEELKHDFTMRLISRVWIRVEDAGLRPLRGDKNSEETEIESIH